MIVFNIFLGTICRITQTGKLVVQVHEGGLKVVPLQNVRPQASVPFSLDLLPMTPPLLHVWTILLSLTTYTHPFKTVPGKFHLVIYLNFYIVNNYF